MQRTLDALIDQRDPMWPMIQDWIAASSRTVTILPVERQTAATTLSTLQVTTRSPLGALAWETGGVLLDHGWLRILGSGHPTMHDGLLSWNGMGTSPVLGLLEDALIVAHDIIGGFFAVDGGAFNGASRHVFYFAPDTLRWEDLDMSHTNFLQWALLGDLPRFYQDQRWTGWEDENGQATGDQGFSFWPMLWTASPAIGERSRRLVPQRELWKIQQDIARQMTTSPDGTTVRLHFTDDQT